MQKQRDVRSSWFAGLVVAIACAGSPWLGAKLVQALLAIRTLIYFLISGSVPAWPPVVMSVALVAGVATLPAGAEPVASADAGTVVYTSLRPGSLDLYLLEEDGGARRLAEDPALDYNPALSPDGRWLAFCSERAGGLDLWTLDLEADGPPRRLTASPALDDAPAFSPDGRSLVFVSTRGGKAAIYRMPFDPGDPAAAEGRAEPLTGGEGGDFNPVFSPDGRRIAFSSNRGIPGGAGSQVWVMAADGGHPVQLTDGDAWNGSPAFGADGSAIYYHRATFHSGPRFDVATATVYRVAAGGGEPVALTAEDGLAAWPAVDGDGRLIYSVRRDDRWRIVVHEDGKASADDSVRDGDDLDLRAPAAAGGRWIAQGPVSWGTVPVSAPGYEAVPHPLGPSPFLATPVRVALDGVKQGDLELDLQPFRHPHPVPDPTRTRWSTSVVSLAVSDFDGGGRREILHAEGGGGAVGAGPMVWGASWSPDGEWIAATVGPVFASPQAPADVWLVRPDGSEPRNLTADSAANDGFPDFSPDGRRIVFRSGRDGGAHELYLMNADGSGVRRLTHHEGTDTMPAFSPRGDEVAFVSTRDDGDYEIYTLEIGGDGAPGELRRITNHAGYDMHPRYSPDGEWLVFTTDRYGFSDERPFDFIPMPMGELAAVRLSDLHTVRLTADKWEDGMALWVAEPLRELIAALPGPVGQDG